MTATAVETVTLPTEILDFIESMKGKPGSLIAMLHKIQAHFDYIPRETILKVAEMTGIPVAQIYGVATFYHLFKLKKPGKHIISVCMGTACYLKGGGAIISELENLLGVSVDEITPDGQFMIKSVRCIGCCGLAPVMTIDDKVYGNVKIDSLPEILSTYKKDT